MITIYIYISRGDNDYIIISTRACNYNMIVDSSYLPQKKCRSAPGWKQQYNRVIIKSYYYIAALSALYYYNIGTAVVVVADRVVSWTAARYTGGLFGRVYRRQDYDRFGLRFIIIYRYYGRRNLSAIYRYVIISITRCKYNKIICGTVWPTF